MTSADNSQNPEAPKLGPVTADELVDDRALESTTDDRFRLTDFVEELAERVRVTPTPTNIALYGAWGSGKTSLGNLLQATFKNDKAVAFGRFDAFKFAEVPLRRHFLATVATWFDIKKSAYSDDLYRETKKHDFHVTKRNVGELVLAIFVAALCLTLVMSLAALVIAAIAHPAHTAAFGKTFVATLRAGAPGILIAAPVVGAVLAMALDRFNYETTISAPFSDEEFEKRFKCLVTDITKKTGCERVLIFIDELDRCSPKQVGSVLETLRTFLDVESCVFIVAADQQVLEHALMEGGARQATPSDGSNPYYSSGSAYLDKIFHQQIPLPPLLPRTLSQFALKLVESRGGVWKRVPNQAELISVLIPNHVRSPRRVKTLLNTFSSLYRLAILRAEDGALVSDVETRASEIGKLVCLRTEFPLFARDLALDARLPQVVLALFANPEVTLEQLQLPGLQAEIFECAKAYAAGRLPVAELLSDGGDTARTVRYLLRLQTGPANAPIVGESEEIELEADDAAEGADANPTSNVQRTYARQLIRYLQRTEAIAGPKRDLVYLESSGLAFDLPPEFADRLEDDARDGRAAEVAEQIKSLSGAEQLDACRFLAQLIVEGTVGLETANVAKSLFAALSAVSEPLDSIAEELLTALANYANGYQLDPADLRGALQLALSSEGRAAQPMLTNVLARDEVLTDEDLGLTALRNAQALAPSFRTRLCAVLAARLPDNPATDIFAALASADDQTVSGIVTGVPQPADAEAPPLHDDLGELADAALEAQRPAVAAAAFDRLLALNTKEARNVAVKLLAQLGLISDPARCRSVVATVQVRVLSDWPRWLTHIETGALKTSDSDDAAALLAALTKIWTERFAPTATQETPPTAAGALAAMQALAAAADGLPVPGFDASATLTTTQPSPVTAETQIALRDEQHSTLRSFEASGLISKAALADALLKDVSQTLTAAIPPPSAPFVEWASESSIAALSDASAEAIAAFNEAVASSTWLDAESRSSLQLLTAAAQRLREGVTASPFTADEIAALLAGNTTLANEAASRWVEAFKPDAHQLVAAFDAQTNAGKLTQRMRQALGVLGDGWGADDKASLFEAISPAFVAGKGSDVLLRDTRIGGADPDRIAASLTKQFNDAGNNAERDRILRLWEIAQPSRHKARQHLVDNVFLPLVQGGKGQAKLALDHFGLVANGVGKPRQKKIKEAFDLVAVGEEDLQKRINRVLQDADWIKRPRFKLRN